MSGKEEKFSYEKAEKESVPCNFCGSSNLKILTNEDSENRGATTVMCKECGLIFINPRMTKENYDRYYQEEYRSKTIGLDALGEEALQNLFNDTYRHGLALGKMMKPFIVSDDPIAEVGSGVGGVLSGIKKVLGKDVLGIEPSASECDFANRNGIKTFCNLFEDFRDPKHSLPRFSAIVCTQSLNHLLDPSSFLVWSRNNLLPNGVLVLEVMNFRHQLKKAGAFRNAVQIDHVYMFTPEVLRNFVESAGFDIVLFDHDEKKDNIRSAHFKEFEALPATHIRIVAKRSKKEPFEDAKIEKGNYYLNLLFINKYYSYAYYFIFQKLPKLIRK